MENAIVIPQPEAPAAPEVNVTIVNADPVEPASNDAAPEVLSAILSRLDSIETRLNQTTETVNELEAEVEAEAEPETEPDPTAVLEIPVSPENSEDTRDPDEAEPAPEAKPRHRWF